jgi:hypothetical protein
LAANLPFDGVNWPLTGSVAHRLHGLDIGCHDVDVQTDASGAYHVATRLHRWVVEVAPELPYWRGVCVPL